MAKSLLTRESSNVHFRQISSFQNDHCQPVGGWLVAKGHQYLSEALRSKLKLEKSIR